MYLFVYGSLKKNGHNHVLLKDMKAKFICDMYTKPKYDLLDLGGIPGMVYGTNKIKGEIYLVRDLDFLDRFEGHPNFYKREIVDKQEYVPPVYGYIFQHPEMAVSTVQPNENGIIEWNV